MFEELKDMLNRELKEITKKGELTAGSLDVIDKLTHSIKSLETIEAMKSHDGRSSYGSYARRGRDGDGDGRYSEDSYGRNAYESRDSATNAMRRRLESMMREPVSENVRLALIDCLDKIG